jgi:hypothetical protein
MILGFGLGFFFAAGAPTASSATAIAPDRATAATAITSATSAERLYTDPPRVGLLPSRPV